MSYALKLNGVVIATANTLDRLIKISKVDADKKSAIDSVFKYDDAGLFQNNTNFTRTFAGRVNGIKGTIQICYQKSADKPIDQK